MEPLKLVAKIQQKDYQIFSRDVSHLMDKYLTEGKESVRIFLTDDNNYCFFVRIEADIV